MTQYGTASVVGADGTITYDGSTAIAAFANNIEQEQRVQIEEFMDGFGELLGFRKADEREYMTLTLIPKAVIAAGGTSAKNDALLAMKYPSVPSLIYFTPNSVIEIASTKDLFGNPAGTPAAGSEFANQWIYVGGARRTFAQGAGGQAALQLVGFKAKSSPLTAAQLVTVAD